MAKDQRWRALFEKTQQIVVEQFGVDMDEVSPSVSFIDDLGADSLDSVELVITFEEKFDTEIPNEDAEKLTTVGETVDYMYQKGLKP